ncbi:MAG: HD family phosphohydrolase [Patescibacteria group bacterium]
MNDEQKVKIQHLRLNIEQLYAHHNKDLLFHGWHHIYFVTQKALEFAKSIQANEFIVESAALTHDLNYIVKPFSEPEDATELRTEILLEAGYTAEEINQVESAIMSAHTANRGATLTIEAQALSDGDTMFKAVPTTLPLFTSKFLIQNKVDLQKLTDKILTEQIPLMDQGIYFYTELAKTKYLKWAQDNLEIWKNMRQALADPDVQQMLQIARDNQVI